MNEILIKRIGKEFTVIKRDKDSLFPNSIYVHLQEQNSHVYLEENEVELILKAIRKLRKD